MKYEFVKNGVDDYSLKYKDKEIKFKSDVSIITRMQETIAAGKLKMVADLTKKGMTVKDLVIVKKVDGKTYYDNTNKIEVENSYIQTEQGLVFNEILKEKLGMDIQQLQTELELTEDDLGKFGEDFAKVITGQLQFPSEERKQD